MILEELHLSFAFSKKGKTPHLGHTVGPRFQNVQWPCEFQKLSRFSKAPSYSNIATILRTETAALGLAKTSSS